MPGPIFEALEQRVDDLLTLPGVALQLIERCSDPEVRISDLVSLIGSDQVMAASILRMANSAFYGRPSSVSTLRDAVMVLGLEAVRALCLGIGVHAIFPPAQGEVKAQLEPLWQHCAAVALCAREIARRVRSRDRERAFVAGLLHDIGQLVLLQYLPDLYSGVVQAQRGSGRPLHEVERQALGTDHAEVGAWLLERWRLPQELRLPVELHHTEAIPAGDEAGLSLARIAQVADWLSATQGLPAPWEEAGFAQPASRAALSMDDDGLVQLCLGLDKRVSQLCSAMGLGQVSPDVFQKALYRANRSLAQMAIDLDVRNRRLQNAFDALALVQEVSAILAGNDDLKSMLDGCVRAICGSHWVDSVQCMVPVGSEKVLVGSADRNSEGVVTSNVATSTSNEWQHLQQARASWPSYRREAFRLMDGGRAELVARLVLPSGGTTLTLDLVPFTSILALAFERSRAHRNLAMVEERRRNEAIRASQPTVEPDDGSASERRLKMVGEMAAGAAHDLNNSLAIVLGQAQLGLISEDIAEAREYLGTIERTAKDCATTVRRLQEFARGARKHTRDEVVDLAAIARETLDITRTRWRDEAQRRGAFINVVVEVTDGLVVKGSAPALREVLTNLIFNAVDALPHGGTLAVRGWADEGQVHLSVRDTGVGMTPEVKERVFEPFFTTKGENGTGLGLAVCKRIVGEHSGRISVYSRAGAGSTFVVSLPAASGLPQERGEESRPVHGRSLSVLVIDDEAQVREVVQRMLRLDGHVAQMAATAREGLDLFSRQPFDIVVTDLGLPDLPGWEVARTIKTGCPTTPVVLVTGWWEEGDRPTDGENVDAILAKPFGIAELRQAVTAAIESIPASPEPLSS